MPAPSRSRAYNIRSGYYDTYPDNAEGKEVKLHTDRQRHPADPPHVYIAWSNGSLANDGTSVMQMVHLTGMEGNYAFHSPNSKPLSFETLTNYPSWSLGTFSRAQRDQILRIAAAIRFERTSVNNRCRAWMWDLLTGMVQRGLITQQDANMLFVEVPLVVRVPE